MTKKKIQEDLHLYIDLDNSFDRIRSELDRVEKENPDHFDFSVAGWTNYEGYKETDVYGYRWETDKELETRKKRSATAKISAKKAAVTKKTNKEKKDLETYEKLKKKYGDK